MAYCTIIPHCPSNCICTLDAYNLPNASPTLSLFPFRFRIDSVILFVYSATLLHRRLLNNRRSLSATLKIHCQHLEPVLEFPSEYPRALVTMSDQKREKRQYDVTLPELAGSWTSSVLPEWDPTEEVKARRKYVLTEPRVSD
jgi:hypothetical protein